MRKVRKKERFSQIDPHNATGIDQTFICDLELGIQNPSPRTVFRVAKGWKFMPGYLSRTPRDQFNLFSLRIAGDSLPAVYGD
jgi:hypothetical protein